MIENLAGPDYDSNFGDKFPIKKPQKFALQPVRETLKKVGDIFQTPYEAARNDFKSDDMSSNQTVNISDVQLLNQRMVTIESNKSKER